MNVRAAILASLSSLSAGCPAPWNCNPESEEFSLSEEPLTPEQVAAFLEDGGHEHEYACSWVCGDVYGSQTGWEASVDTCSVEVLEGSDEGGTVTCTGIGFEYFCDGRRPIGHAELPEPDEPSLGAFWAAQAYLEAASVHAFEELALLLGSWGAPASLIGRCWSAADDERHHARWLGALAASHGSAVPEPQVGPRAVPDLHDVALHNAVEGCVHETWAALCAHWKAQHAQTPGLRALYTRIAEDETRHAQLAWDLHAWFLEQLDPAEQDTVVAAQTEALEALHHRADITWALSPADLGPPSQAEVQALVNDFTRRLVA